MEKTLKFIKESYPDIEVFKRIKINEYFTASYVIAQNGIVIAVFVPFKTKPGNLNGMDKDLYYHSSGKTNGITFYFFNEEIYRNIPNIKVIGVEEIIGKEEIFKLFSKEIFIKKYEIVNNDIKNCLNEISKIQKYAIEKFNGSENLDSLIYFLQIDYVKNYKTESFSHNIKYKNSDNKIHEIWLSYNSQLHQIKLKEECENEYLNGFELNFTGKNPYLNPNKVIKDCMNYIEIFKNTDYLVSIFY